MTERRKSEIASVKLYAVRWESWGRVRTTGYGVRLVFKDGTSDVCPHGAGAADKGHRSRETATKCAQSIVNKMKP